MDPRRLDDLARAVAAAPSRRTLLRGAVGGLTGGLLARLGRAEAGNGCRGTEQRCGGECCDRAQCFIDPGESQETTSDDVEFCCPRSKICRSPRGSRYDRCCYRDEVCQKDGTCCRRCAGRCCRYFEHCVDGRCKPLGSVRYARLRR